MVFGWFGLNFKGGYQFEWLGLVIRLRDINAPGRRPTPPLLLDLGRQPEHRWPRNPLLPTPPRHPAIPNPQNSLLLRLAGTVLEKAGLRGRVEKGVGLEGDGGGELRLGLGLGRELGRELGKELGGGLG
jgi:hypothetical protein